MKFLQFEIFKFFQHSPQSPAACAEYLLNKMDIEIDPEQISALIESSKNKNFLKIDHHYPLQAASVFSIRHKFKEFFIQQTKKTWEKTPPKDEELPYFSKSFEYIHQNKTYEALYLLDKGRKLFPENILIAKLYNQLYESIVKALKNQQQNIGDVMSVLLKEVKSFNPTFILDKLLIPAKLLISKLGLILLTLAVFFIVEAIIITEKACFFCVRENFTFFMQNYWIVLLSVPIQMTIHEFGHAIMCHRFGGKVSKMGIISFYGFLPTAYADVTDSYRMKRYQRVLVSMAGAGAQIIFGFLCGFLMLYTDTGSFWYKVMWINFSVGGSSFIMNYLPGFKNDGYYILADLSRIENLLTRSFAYCKGWLSNFFFGLGTTLEKVTLREKTIFWSYFFFIGFQWTFFTTLFLSMVAITWKNMSLLPRIMMFLMLIRVLFYVITNIKNIDLGKIIAFFRHRRIAISFSLMLLLLLPVPRKFNTIGIVQSHQETDIKSPVDGFIQEIFINSDEHVKQGESLYSIKSPDLLANYSKSIWHYFQVKSELDELIAGPSREERLAMQTSVNVQKQLVVDMLGKIKLYQKASLDGLIPEDEMRKIRETLENENIKLNLKNATQKKELLQNQNRISILQDELRLAILNIKEFEKKLKYLNVRAPHDGFLHMDNLSSLQGRYVKEGESLFTWMNEASKIVVMVPETSIEEIEINQTAYFYTTRGDKIPLIVEEVSHIAEKLTDEPTTIRGFFPDAKIYNVVLKQRDTVNIPIYIGESGKVKISIGWNTIFINLFHNLLVKFRVSLWKIF